MVPQGVIRKISRKKLHGSSSSGACQRIVGGEGDLFQHLEYF